ncbi:hypothetical protein SAMN05428987_5253 [Paenibacillus sp. CF095]|uniref:hypothetical protein n=1 Tax=Paenibacillus sp. CF095 TaxID=1881033 RepID=UPI00088CBC93|nr:hypothetical protein [Paenibacillus sp. CF095]SDD55063.1 hypothetical protein SAMN05428987_5253 [Paenibacillus sp. CF095]
MIRVVYVNADGNGELAWEDREDAGVVLHTFTQGAVLNLRYSNGSFWRGTYSQACFDKEIDDDGNIVLESLYLYFNHTDSQ